MLPAFPQLMVWYGRQATNRVITVLWGEHSNEAGADCAEAHSEETEPCLERDGGDAIKKGFLEEARLKSSPRERKGVCWARKGLEKSCRRKPWVKEGRRREDGAPLRQPIPSSLYLCTLFTCLWLDTCEVKWFGSRDNAFSLHSCSLSCPGHWRVWT